VADTFEKKKRETTTTIIVFVLSLFIYFSLDTFEALFAVESL
jgi:hypothetical protein